ncbi:MAG TPA: hypothetical protein VHB98_25080 [Chloroflexota bacterium]|nr:hypothetical protein [Chloroflexota bacterium]
MTHLFGTYSSVLIPAALALLAAGVFIKLIIAIEHAVLRIVMSVLTIMVLGTALVAGSSMIGRINGIQDALAGAVRSAHATSTGGTIQAPVLQQQIVTSADQALTSMGLSPAYLHIRITCSATGATLHLRYSDPSFLGGLLNHQDLTAPLPANVRCR